MHRSFTGLEGAAPMGDLVAAFRADVKRVAFIAPAVISERLGHAFDRYV